jgi:membrane protein implicated in regulation of membrane protease activity
MAWSQIFILCLAVGFALSVVSLLSGAIHMPHVHFHWHGGGMGHVGGHSGNRGGSAFNLFTLAAFLMWFGGSGYLLERLTLLVLLPVLAIATPAGFIGAAIVYWFLARVMASSERPLDPADYDMTGALGRLASSLRPGGTGEMIFAQEGVRRGVAVRSETGEPIEQGAELVVTRYEGGIAYVRTWEELQKL